MRTITTLICLFISRSLGEHDESFEDDDDELKCKFTIDCQQYQDCKLLAVNCDSELSSGCCVNCIKSCQDAYCRCNFGKCAVIGSSWLGRPKDWIPECKEYKDCDCKYV